MASWPETITCCNSVGQILGWDHVCHMGTGTEVLQAPQVSVPYPV